MSDEPQLQADVAIIGGGAAGATAALCLARAGVRALIVERQQEVGERPGESLAPSATPLLARLGVLPAFLATAPLASYGNRSSWGGDGRLTDYDFIRDPHGHGWHLDRRRFDRMLLDEACSAGAGLVTGASLAGVRRAGARRWLLDVARAGERLCVSAGFVIDASGRSAAFARRRLGAGRHVHDRLLAVTASLRPLATASEDTTTLVEAVPEGWWYSAVVPDGRLVTTFLTDPDILVGLGAWRRDGLAALRRRAPYTQARVEAGRYCTEGTPHLAAAATSCLDQASGSGWLAAGDAAASYDPLSSHGIGTAISAGMRAAGVARRSLSGDERALDGYSSWLRAGFERYLPLWRAYYAQERRWPDEPFWARRRVSTPAAIRA